MVRPASVWSPAEPTQLWQPAGGPVWAAGGQQDPQGPGQGWAHSRPSRKHFLEEQLLLRSPRHVPGGLGTLPDLSPGEGGVLSPQLGEVICPTHPGHVATQNCGVSGLRWAVQVGAIGHQGVRNIPAVLSP